MKFIIFRFAFIFLFSSSALAVANKYIVSTNGGCLNFRSQPTTINNKPMMCVPNTSLGIVEVSRRGEWIQVDYNGIRGWMYSKYLKPANDALTQVAICVDCMPVPTLKPSSLGKIPIQKFPIPSPKPARAKPQKVAISPAVNPSAPSSLKFPNVLESGSASDYLNNQRAAQVSAPAQPFAQTTNDQASEIVYDETTTRDVAAFGDGEIGVADEYGFTPEEYNASPVQSQKNNSIKSNMTLFTSVGSRNENQLVSVPLYGRNQTLSFCKMQHVSNYKRPVASRTTACLFAAVGQEWQKLNNGFVSDELKIIFNDITYGPSGKPNNWEHRSHASGECIDIRPMRKSVIKTVNGEKRIHSIGVNPVVHYSDYYNREKTRELLDLLIRYGAETSPRKPGSTTQFFFNDPLLYEDDSSKAVEGLRKAGGHDGHIHVCIRNNAENRKKCNEYNFEERHCPQLVKKLPEPIRKPERSAEKN